MAKATLRISQDKVRTFMREAHIATFGELAARIGVCRQSVYQWMGGRSGTTLGHVAAMCDALGCEPADILVYEPAQELVAVT